LAIERGHLLYSAGFVRTLMIEPGRTGAYLALFGELGFSLLITTLIGALGGNWIDGQLRTSPIFLIVGFLAGAALGAGVMYQLVNRFLAKFD
jgi:hypothetical protein